MKENIKNFLERLANDPNYDFKEVIKDAHEILREEFKEEVVRHFEYINENHNSPLKEAVLKDDKMKFIHECYYSFDKRDFLNNNFGKLDEILAILKEFITSEEEGAANE